MGGIEYSDVFALERAPWYPWAKSGPLVPVSRERIMKRSKTLGLLVIAVLATTAFFGSASASASKFTASKTGASLTETTLTKHAYTITGSKVECSEYNIEGKTEALESEQISWIPSYSGCTAFGFAAQLTNDNCRHISRANGDTIKEPANIMFACTTTMHVANAFAHCMVVVKSQTVTSSASYTNGEGDVKVKYNSTGMHAEVTESTGLCPLTVGTHTNATYTGESTIQVSGGTLQWDK
jgi:hypothetical protein